MPNPMPIPSPSVHPTPPPPRPSPSPNPIAGPTPIPMPTHIPIPMTIPASIFPLPNPGPNVCTPSHSHSFSYTNAQHHPHAYPYSHTPAIVVQGSKAQCLAMCAIVGHGAPQLCTRMGSQRMHTFLVGFGALVGNVAGAMGGFACAPWSAGASTSRLKRQWLEDEARHYALGGCARNRHKYEHRHRHRQTGHINTHNNIGVMKATCCINGWRVVHVVGRGGVFIPRKSGGWQIRKH